MFLRKFDEADILLRNNHKDYELAHYLLKFIKIQIKNFEIINSSKLDDIISLIQKEKDDKTTSLSTKC